MKKILPILLIAVLLSSCASITKNLQRGNYDQVIHKTTKKIIRKPKVKYADAMDKAYRLANERDLERISYLEREDNPAYYDELFARYASLKERQQKVRTVTPLTIDGKNYSYEYVDYDARIVESKKKAAEEFYRSGKQLITNAHTKMDFRDAHMQLIRAREYGAYLFSDIEALMHEARMMGISRVIVIPENRDPHIGIPEIDLDYLIAFDTRNLESNQWTEFHFEHVGGDVNYDYEIFVRILAIEISDNKENITREEFKGKSKTVFDYALDADGNVMKDTSGNDIKIYKDIMATLMKKQKVKTCKIRGEVETISIFGEPRGSLAKVPFTANSKFENVSYDLIGNSEAVSPEILKLTKQQELSFPTETTMVKQCIEDAKPVVKEVVLESSNRYIK